MMNAATPAARPIEQLRDNAKRLEAALSVGLASSTAKAVHELRSSTRRVEAQLNLLAMVPGLPRWKPAAKKLQRRLDKLRRVAGHVRDCDVQEKLLKDQDRAMRSKAEAPADLESAQEKLRKKIQKTRQRNEKKLLAAVEQQLPKLARNTEQLLKCLEPAEDHELPISELLVSVRRQVERLMHSREQGEDHLHDVRKAAKRARYQCEAMPGPQAAASAKRLEELQDAGGSWHDFLDLAALCHKEFGPEHPLSHVLEHLRDEHLDRYLANLDAFRKQHIHAHAASSSKRKPPQAATKVSPGSSRKGGRAALSR